MWLLPTQQQRNSDPEHCPELFMTARVLSTHQCLTAAQQTYAEYEAQQHQAKAH